MERVAWRQLALPSGRQGARGVCCVPRGAQSVLHDSLEGCNAVGGRLRTEGTQGQPGGVQMWWEGGSGRRGLRDSLEGWAAVGGRLRMEGTHVRLWLIRVDAMQKPIQYCKAVILQLKRKKLEKTSRKSKNKEVYIE